MKRKINNKLIRSFIPCYDPLEISIPNNESLTIKEWIIKYRDLVKNEKDIIWLICRKEFMTDKNMRLFAVWCAREALKLTDNPDKRSIEACNISEKFANNNATIDELSAAESAARAAAAESAARAAAAWAAESAAWAAATAWAAESAWAARAAIKKTRISQINQLLSYFKS